MIWEAAITMHCCSGPKFSYAGPAKFGKWLLGFNGCAMAQAMRHAGSHCGSRFCDHTQIIYIGKIKMPFINFSWIARVVKGKS